MRKDDNNGAKKRAVVLLSGGLDSTTCLAYALDKGYKCFALSVNYGQKHNAEINAASRIARHYNCEHRIVDIDVGQFGGSALTDDSISVPTPDQPSAGIPTTYVPARNTMMLAIALGWAEILHARDIYIGVNAVDFSGYPDCRPEYIAAYNRLAKLATKAGVEGGSIEISAPLQHMGKQAIIALGGSLGVDYSMTVTCYQADESGAACGRCEACQLRRLGFEKAGLADPTAYA
ncbi:MAG: 7-cyano-7-deazaguanine synthase QueC [Gammaproteobacteria bacterium]